MRHVLLEIAIFYAVAGFPAEEAEVRFEATILLFSWKSLAPSAALGAAISYFVEIYLSLSRLVGSCTARIPAAVKTHCYSRSDGLIQAQGSAGVPKAVYD